MTDELITKRESVECCGNARTPSPHQERSHKMQQKYLKPHDFNFCLAHVVEECGEVLAAAGKTQRWGWASVNPEIPEANRQTNLVWLLAELGDLEGAIARLKNCIEQDHLP